MLLNKIKVKPLQLMREVKMKLNLGIMDLEIKWKLFLLKVIQLKYLHFFIMNMMKKLGVHNTVNLVKIALEYQLVE